MQTLLHDRYLHILQDLHGKDLDDKDRLEMARDGLISMCDRYKRELIAQHDYAQQLLKA